jgi:hypothetical protein
MSVFTRPKKVNPAGESAGTTNSALEGCVIAVHFPKRGRSDKRSRRRLKSASKSTRGSSVEALVLIRLRQSQDGGLSFP